MLKEVQVTRLLTFLKRLEKQLEAHRDAWCDFYGVKGHNTNKCYTPNSENLEDYQRGKIDNVSEKARMRE